MGSEQAPASVRWNRFRLCLLLLAALSALLLVRASLRARPEVARNPDQQRQPGESWLLLNGLLNSEGDLDSAEGSSPTIQASGQQGQQTGKSFKQTNPDEHQATLRPRPERGQPGEQVRAQRSRRLAPADRKCRPR